MSPIQVTHVRFQPSISKRCLTKRLEIPPLMPGRRPHPQLGVPVLASELQTTLFRVLVVLPNSSLCATTLHQNHFVFCFPELKSRHFEMLQTLSCWPVVLSPHVLNRSGCGQQGLTTSQGLVGLRSWSELSQCTQIGSNHYPPILSMHLKGLGFPDHRRAFMHFEKSSAHKILRHMSC